MNRPELTLLLEGRRNLTREEALLLQRIGRTYSFGVPPLRRADAAERDRFVLVKRNVT